MAAAHATALQQRQHALASGVNLKSKELLLRSTFLEFPFASSHGNSAWVMLLISSNPVQLGSIKGRRSCQLHRRSTLMMERLDAPSSPSSPSPAFLWQPSSAQSSSSHIFVIPVAHTYVRLNTREPVEHDGSETTWYIVESRVGSGESKDAGN